MSKKNTKYYKSYDDQIKLLKDRNLIIRGDSSKYGMKSIIRHYLSEYSYYDLANGIGRFYTHPTSNTRDHSVSRHFNNGITLNYLVALRAFDQKVRCTLFPQILNIETSLKTKLSHVMGKHPYALTHNNNLGYLTDIHLYQCKYYNKDLCYLRDLVRRSYKKEHKGTPLYHYKRDHKNVPSWILVTGITFGRAAYWFNILSKSNKMIIIKQMLRLWDKNYKGLLKPWRLMCLFRQCLKILVTFRNACAHGDIMSFTSVNIYNYTKFKHIPLHYETMLSKLLLGYSNTGNPNKNDLIQHNDFRGHANIFSCIISIILLTDDKRQLIDFLYDVKKLFKEAQNLSVTPAMGIPKNAYLRINSFINKEIYY